MMKASLAGLFRRAVPANPWQPADVPYPALAALDTKLLRSQAGVYALWHLGVRPRWLRVGGAADLGAALDRLKLMAEIRESAVHGGVYAAWTVQPAAAIPSVLAFLAAELHPALQSLVMPNEIAAAPAATAAFPLPPGTQTIAPAVEP